MIDGKLPKRVKNMALEWADMHGDELVLNWERLQSSGELSPIEPLE